jgi:hypothetical protein
VRFQLISALGMVYFATDGHRFSQIKIKNPGRFPASFFNLCSICVYLWLKFIPANPRPPPPSRRCLPRGR